MSLPPDTRLGPYAILTKLGEGGMGEVYRARDTKLDRDVALKILPAAFTADPDRLMRFAREAKTLAALNHPNIAAIHGLEDSPSASSGQAGVRALVMEFVDGDDLSVRIGRGAMPIDEALPIAKQIAEALEAAHEQGIIHRDLKPANIKVRPDGTVKVLDFGLAKVFDARAASVSGGVGARLASPLPEPVGESGVSDSHATITTPAHLRQGYGGQAMTQAGVILGTAAYMAPEQARGLAVDRRADIWAFGVVLYEMLSGRRPFDGASLTDVLASVVKSEPDWSALPPDTPTSVRRVLRRALAKDRSQRLQDIGDARIDLAETTSEPLPSMPARSAGSKSAALAAWLGWPAAAIALAVALWALYDTPATVPQVQHLGLDIPEGYVIANGAFDSPVMSGDGTTLVLNLAREAEDGSGPASASELFVKRFDEPAFRAVPGTEGAAMMPFFSPDGQWIGFGRKGRLWKAPVSAGAPVAIAEISEAFVGGAWLPDDTIVLTPSPTSGLFTVPASGGTIAPLTTLDLAAGEQDHDFPVWIPGTRLVLFAIWKGGSLANSDIAVIDMDTRQRRTILQGGTVPGYVHGFVVYGHQGKLFAVRFDPARGATIGTPQEVYDHVLSPLNVPTFALSPTGTLVALRGGVEVPDDSVVWVARDSSMTRVFKGSFAGAALSPDGRRLAYATVENRLNIRPWAVRIRDLEQGTDFPLSADTGWSTSPSWSPDGRRVAFSSGRAGGLSLFVSPASPNSQPEPLLPPGTGMRADVSWTSDGRAIVFTEDHPDSDDIWMVPLTGSDRTPRALVATKADEMRGRVAPDGRRFAYLSDVGGQYQVWVEPFPPTGERWQVSQGGASVYEWTFDGRLSYQRQTAKGAEVKILRLAPPPAAATVASEETIPLPPNVNMVAVARDGRVLAIETEPPPTRRRISVVQNWHLELERRFAGK